LIAFNDRGADDDDDDDDDDRALAAGAVTEVFDVFLF
jgi:hypothetical protein